MMQNGIITVNVKAGRVYCLNVLGRGDFSLDIDWGQGCSCPPDGRYLVQGNLRKEEASARYWFESSLPPISLPEGVVNSINFAGQIAPHRFWTTDRDKKRASFFVSVSGDESLLVVATKPQHIRMLEKVSTPPSCAGIAIMRGFGDGWRLEASILKFVS